MLSLDIILALKTNVMYTSVQEEILIEVNSLMSNFIGLLESQLNLGGGVR